MATAREREILELIEKEPLISQREIASRCKITRSSVAVHISNLMRKGLLLGRGYVLPQGAYAVVVGGANMDIGGTPSAPMVDRDSNPGTVRFSPGGVGRNIAHNLALLGAQVKLVTLFGEDASGAALLEGCRRAGVDTAQSQVVAGAASAVYLFITSHTGEMELAVNSMDIYEGMTPEFIKGKMQAVNNAALCVADTNLPGESLAYLARHALAPLYVDPVSTIKGKKLRGLLPHIDTLKANRMEAAMLAEAETDDLAEIVKALRKKGVGRVAVTLGPDGVFGADETGTFHLPRFAGPVQNTTGAGDAFMAALACAAMKGMPFARAAEAGLAASALCVAAGETVSPAADFERVMAVANREKTVEEAAALT